MAKVYRDSDIKMSKENLSDFLYAVIVTESSITSTFVIDGHYKNYKQNNVLLRINIDEGNIGKFEEIVGYKLTKPEPIGGA